MSDFKVTELDENIDFGNLPSWDVVIIGAGPAGLAASLTTAHRGLTTLVLEAKDRAGGQPQFLYPDKKIVDIRYKIDQGPEVTIDKIMITGNTKTRDKVLRRELKVEEQERFSGTKLKKSRDIFAATRRT